MAETVSICIPSYNRPALIRSAIESCFAQKMRAVEILVGDDSVAGDTDAVVASIVPPDGFVIRYERNPSTLGQSRNVNALFRRARGRHVMLLHDDDLLCAGGLDRLRAALADDPRRRCAYGLQRVLDANGAPLEERTLRWNERDFRLPEHAGAQHSAMRAALRQQVPNDGYLIDAELARDVGCRHESEVGHAVDARFVIDVAKRLGAGSFFFLPVFVSEYRLTADSIARSPTINTRQDLFFASLLADASLREEADALEGLLRRISAGAALDAAVARRRLAALRILFSRYYDKPYLSRWTIYRLICVLSAPLGRRLKAVVTGK